MKDILIQISDTL